jgi:hypothetical protein
MKKKKIGLSGILHVVYKDKGNKNVVRENWRALVNTVMNLRSRKNRGIS